MKIRVVEFKYVHSNPALWVLIFSVDSMLFMLGLVYCLQKGIFALIVVFPLILYALTALFYERTRRKAPSLLMDMDSIKWRQHAHQPQRVRFRNVESMSFEEWDNDFRLVLLETSGKKHSIAIPGLGTQRRELEIVLKKKAREYGFSFV